MAPARDDRRGAGIGVGANEKRRRGGGADEAGTGGSRRNNIAAQMPARRTQRAIAVFTAGSIIMVLVSARSQSG